MADDPKHPADDPEETRPDGPTETEAEPLEEMHDSHDRPRGPGAALLVSGLLVWAGVVAVRTLAPADGPPTHPTSLDLPEDLPRVDEEHDDAHAAHAATEGVTPSELVAADAADAADLDAAQADQADQAAQANAASDEVAGDTVPATGEHVADSVAEAALSIHLGPRDPQWDSRFEAPDTVHYTIRHGGTLKRVANLYKIFHHEIAALNPGVDLDKELGPGTRIVIYRQSEGDVPGESIDQPSRGALRGAIPMPEGPGRVLKHIPWKGWATPEAVAVMDSVLRSWDGLDTGQPILVGNMSARKGGRLQPHQSHQSGRDIDLSYPQIRNPREELNWREMTDANLDRALTWKLLEILNDTGAVEVIYIDTRIQKLLYDWAVKTGSVPRADLGRWLEYPRKPGHAKSARVQHSRGHSDHMHVRFSCPRSHRRCR